MTSPISTSRPRFLLVVAILSAAREPTKTGAAPAMRSTIIFSSRRVLRRRNSPYQSAGERGEVEHVETQQVRDGSINFAFRPPPLTNSPPFPSSRPRKGGDLGTGGGEFPMPNPPPRSPAGASGGDEEAPGDRHEDGPADAARAASHFFGSHNKPASRHKLSASHRRRRLSRRQLRWRLSQRLVLAQLGATAMTAAASAAGSSGGEFRGSSFRPTPPPAGPTAASAAGSSRGDYPAAAACAAGRRRPATAATSAAGRSRGEFRGQFPQPRQPPAAPSGRRRNRGRADADPGRAPPSPRPGAVTATALLPIPAPRRPGPVTAPATGAGPLPPPLRCRHCTRRRRRYRPCAAWRGDCAGAATVPAPAPIPPRAARPVAQHTAAWRRFVGP
jgi:hypothetical protein